MNKTLLLIAFVSASLVAACSFEVNEPTRPGGTGIHVETPSGIVDAVAGHDDELLTAAARECEEGTHSSCNIVAHMLTELGEHDELVASIHRSTCEAGFAGSCRELANQGRIDGGEFRNAEEAHRVLRRGCDLGHGGSCHDLAVAYAGGHLPSEDGAGVQLLHETCLSGHTESCTEAGALSMNRADPPAAADPATDDLFFEAPDLGEEEGEEPAAVEGEDEAVDTAPSDEAAEPEVDAAPEDEAGDVEADTAP